MPLTLMYITNDPMIALVAEKNGVDRIWVDLEVLGKEERQKNMDCVKSHHSIDDVRKLSKILTKSELMVRIDPWNDNSVYEINSVIEAGAKRIMLPMWRSCAETDAFFNAVGGRVKTTLLLETKEAVQCVDEVLENPLVDEMHIGLNDLHLSYGLSFMFELLTNGIVESLCDKFKKSGIPYGFGGIAKLGAGMLPAEKIIMEHYRLGSTRAILSRSFCDAEKIRNIESVAEIFDTNMVALRGFERTMIIKTYEDYRFNAEDVGRCVEDIVRSIKEK